jgi:hypothetical protein
MLIWTWRLIRIQVSEGDNYKCKYLVGIRRSCYDRSIRELLRTRVWGTNTHQRPNMLPTASSLTDRPAIPMSFFTYLQMEDNSKVYKRRTSHILKRNRVKHIDYYYCTLVVSVSESVFYSKQIQTSYATIIVLSQGYCFHQMLSYWIK